MHTPVGLDQCLTFINCQLQPPDRAASKQNGTAYRAVTISRQTGSGGHVVASELASILQANTPRTSCPWTVFDRNLVEKVLEDHHLSKHLARFMPEDRISELSDTMDELFGLHPPSWSLVRDTTDTVLKLAELGRVILIGRGAHIITAKQEYVYHVRLVGSVERRAELIQETRKLSRKAALAVIETEDRGRRRYLKKYFGADIDDPLLYHLVINTDRIGYSQAAQLIAQAMLT